MRLLLLIPVPLLFFGCAWQNPRVANIPEIQALVESGYRGPVSIEGYYYFHPEEDVLYHKPQPNSRSLDFDIPHVLLSLDSIAQTEKLNSWMDRQQHMAPYEGKRIEVSGRLRKEPRRGGGPIIHPYPVRIFIEVEEIKGPNQPVTQRWGADAPQRG